MRFMSCDSICHVFRGYTAARPERAHSQVHRRFNRTSRMIRDSFFLTLFTLSVLYVAAAAPTSVSSDSVELSPSLQLVGKYDWEIIKTAGTGESWSRCLDMVWRAVKANSSRLNFVPTHHWLPEDDTLNGISSFCYMDTVGPVASADAGADYACMPWSRAAINEYRESMKLCFAEALRQGLTVYVRPHLDDGTLKGAWRNGLLMQPMVRYGNFSYHDIMLAPLADALREAVAITTAEESIKPPPGYSHPTVYFALQGEMSATIMRFASEWAQVIPSIRQRILGANTNSSGLRVKIGIGLNFNRLDDTTSVAKQWDSSRLSWLAWQVGAEPPAGTRDGVPAIDVDGLKRLFKQHLDFVGISAYAPYNLAGGSFSLSEFENSAFIFCNEMSEAYGVDVAGMAKAGKLELQYSEFGIGGGSSYAGDQPARSPSEVALRPFFGVYGPYTTAKDPWSIPANKAFRQTFFYKAMQWLADPNKSTHRISSVFIWSMASWDVLGVYPESTTRQGSYRDEDVLSAVAAYNTDVRAAKDADPVDEAAQAGQGTVTRKAPPPAAAARTGVQPTGAGPAGPAGAASQEDTPTVVAAAG